MRKSLANYKKITKSQMQRLRELNAKCMEAERRILDMGLELDRELKTKVDSKKNRIIDYDLHAVVEFYHSGKDEKYDDPIAQCDCYLAGCSEDGRYQLLCDGENWNDHAHTEGHPLYGEHFCHLFHDLTDHHRKFPQRRHKRDVTLGELLLIDTIWIDVKSTMQMSLRIKKAVVKSKKPNSAITNNKTKNVQI